MVLVLTYLPKRVYLKQTFHELNTVEEIAIVRSLKLSKFKLNSSTKFSNESFNSEKYLRTEFMILERFRTGPSLVPCTGPHKILRIPRGL